MTAVLSIVFRALRALLSLFRSAQAPVEPPQPQLKGLGPCFSSAHGCPSTPGPPDALGWGCTPAALLPGWDWWDGACQPLAFPSPGSALTVVKEGCAVSALTELGYFVSNRIVCGERALVRPLLISS